MRLFGKRVSGRIEELSEIRVKIGGYDGVIVPFTTNGWAMLTIEGFEENLDKDSKLARCGSYQYMLTETKGSFSERALKLVQIFSKEMLLFPVKFEDALTRHRINGEFLHRYYEKAWKNLPLGPNVGFNIRFEGQAEPTNIILEINGRLEIYDDYFSLWKADFPLTIEKKSRMNTRNQDYVEEVINCKAEEIHRQTGKLIGEKPLKLDDFFPSGMFGDSRNACPFEVTGPISGREIVRWIVQSAIDVGVIISETELAEWDLKLP